MGTVLFYLIAALAVRYTSILAYINSLICPFSDGHGVR